MKVIALGRGEGKTTELIKMSAETWDYMVVKDRKMARYTFEMATQMGLEIPFPMTYDEFNRGMYSFRISGVLIDDLELYLQTIIRSGVPIHAITISPGDPYNPEEN